jgi:hypothetical protein
MPYRIAKTRSAPDAAYLAGLIDGEGTIALTRRHACEHRHVVVSISSTEMELLAWAKETTGVGKTTRKRTVSDRHAPSLRGHLPRHHGRVPSLRISDPSAALLRERQFAPILNG